MVEEYLMANHQNPEDLPIPVAEHDPYSGQFFFGDPKGDELRESLNRAPSEDKKPLDGKKEAITMEVMNQLSGLPELSMNARMTIAHIRAAKIHGMAFAEFKKVFPPVADLAVRMAKRFYALGLEEEATYATGDRTSVPLGQQYIYDSSSVEDLDWMQDGKDKKEDKKEADAPAGGNPKAPAGMATNQESGALEAGETITGLEEPADKDPFAKVSAHILVSFPNLEMRNYGKRPYFVHKWVESVRDTMVREGGSWVGTMDAKRLFASFRTAQAAARFASYLKLEHHVPENTIDVGESHGG